MTLTNLAMGRPAPDTRNAPDWASVRACFPACEALSYFDSARKAILPSHVGRTFAAWLDDVDATGGVEAFSFEKVEQARTQMARTYGAPPSSLAFIKNTSEGINIVAHGYGPLKPGDNVLVSGEEHENNVLPWRRLAQRGIEVRIVAADAAGHVGVEAFRAAADSKTRVIAVSWVTYGRGVRLDLPALGQYAAEQDILLTVDAIQGLGVIDARLDQLGAGVIAAGGHKGLFGLNGSGLLYVGADVIDRIEPPYAAKYSFTSNDRFQDEPFFAPDAHRFEYGNPNFAGIAILKESAAFIDDLSLKAIAARVEELTGVFIECADRIGLVLRSPREWPRRAGILSFETPGNAAEVLAALRAQNIIMSEKDGHVRASVHVFNTEDEIGQAAAALADLGLVVR